MPESEPMFDLTEEIRSLETALEEKRRALKEQQSQEAPSSPEHIEKALLHDVIGERIQKVQEAAPGDDGVPSSPSVTLQAPVVDLAAKRKADEIREKAHEAQIHDLVDIAAKQGIEDAVLTARQLQNPHILDDFHDALVDEYYEKLFAKRE